jgi:O-antigen/teichoic acid export membrane protein
MLLTLIGRLLQFVIMFASVKIMTSILTPEEMGKYSLVMTTTAMFAMLLINPVGMYINRRLHEWVERGLFRQVFHNFLIYIVFVALAITMFAWGYGLTDYFKIQWPWWMLAVLVGGSIVFNSVNQTLVPSLNMVGRVSAFSMLTVLTLLCSLMLSIALTRWVEASAQYWLLGTLLGQIFFSGIAYAVFFKGHGTVARFSWPKVEMQQLRTLIIFCAPVAVAAVLSWSQAQGYRYVLAQTFGVAELGLFAAGYGLAASLMAALETILTTWFQPRFYRQSHASEPEVRRQAWIQYAQIILSATLLGAIGLAFVAQEVTPLFLGEQFHNVSYFVVVGAFSEWVRIQVGTFGLIEHLKMTTIKLMLPSCVGMVSTYVGMFVLFPVLGIVAAPLASILGGGLSILVVCLGNRSVNYSMRFSAKAFVPVFFATLIIGLSCVFIKPFFVGLVAWLAGFLWLALVSVVLGVSGIWLLKRVL